MGGNRGKKRITNKELVDANNVVDGDGYDLRPGDCDYGLVAKQMRAVVQAKSLSDAVQALKELDVANYYDDYRDFAKSIRARFPGRLGGE